MIRENFKIEKEEGKAYPPMPENIYQVQIFDVNAEKRPTYDTRTKPAEQQAFENVLKFQYTLLSGEDLTATGGKVKNLRGRNVWDNFVKASLYIGKNGKCPLYQIIESCLKRALTPEEEATFESSKVNKLVGMQLRIGTKHKKGSGDKVYDNVDSYYAVESQLPALTEEEKENARVKTKEEKEKTGLEGLREQVKGTDSGVVEIGEQTGTFDTKGSPASVPQEQSPEQPQDMSYAPVEDQIEVKNIPF